ncbi:MAG: hypothetical protein M1830_000321 [Pleopsidium flavum]|nr:MAG: hypothetical protein M1830_000321 [Pleopsidium flavum]
MATSRQTSSSTTSPAPHTTCYDPLDIDSFINYDQVIYPSPSMSPTSSRSKSVVNPNFAFGNSNNTLLPQNQLSHHQTFSGPSHQYDLHKQQTGLPFGALANTMAVNEASNIPYSALSTADSFFGMNSTDDFIDFGAVPSKNPSFSAASDMEMDFDSPSQDGLPAFFFPQGSQSSNTDYVDPNAVGGHEEMSNTPVPSQSNVGRLWPGVHQQQAAMARAQAQIQTQTQTQTQTQAQAQGQQQKQKQKQKQDLQQQQLAPQLPSQQTSRPNRSAAHQPTDPIVEERISRLLNQMRQGSVASSEDDATAGANGALPHIARMRKEEEDMDEDERLLASEEGKKLSSKERRQLRNKVSARAFRSRRKEYIGQLEGEVAAKINEANDFRAQNQALMAENQRLSDLTRMLLSSSAFSTFLNDLSTDGMPVPTTPAPEQPATTQATVVQPNIRKDPNPHRLAHQQAQAHEQDGAQVEMALVPDNALDFSTLDLNNSAFASNMPQGYDHAQVFSVTQFPQGPAVDRIDTAVLSGKSSNFVGSYMSSDDCKCQAPAIERIPATKKEPEEGSILTIPCLEVDFDESDPAFALFTDAPSSVKSSPAESQELLFGGLESEKVFARLEIVVQDASADNISAAAMERFERLCFRLEAAFERIGNMTSHL